METMTRLNKQQQLIICLGEYFDLLQNFEDNAVGYLGNLITQELQQAKTPKELNQIYTYLAEYHCLIKKSTEGKQGFLLETLLENLEALTANE